MADNTKDAPEDKGLVLTVGPLRMDVPRSLGYFGGIALAVALEVIDPPLALFIAAIPIMKMLDFPRLPRPSRFLGQVLEGASQPLGGDAEGTVKLVGAQSNDDSA